jgi:hypothetical protein
MFTLSIEGIEPFEFEKESQARYAFDDTKRGIQRGNILAESVTLSKEDKTLDAFYLSKQQAKELKKRMFFMR